MHSLRAQVTLTLLIFRLTRYERVITMYTWRYTLRQLRKIFLAVYRIIKIAYIYIFFSATRHSCLSLDDGIIKIKVVCLKIQI